jgi:hypothetical protein
MQVHHIDVIKTTKKPKIVKMGRKKKLKKKLIARFALKKKKNWGCLD